MIGVFEGMVRQNPQRTCFTFVDKEGNVEAFSYREARMMAAGLASLLRRRGVEPGDAVVIDLPNNPAFVIMLLAAAYGWMVWMRGSEKETRAELPITHTPLKRYLPLLLVFLAAFFGIAWILIRFTDSNVPWLDSFTTALSIIGMWMLARKYVEQWWAWIVVDVVCCGLYIYKELYFTSALYGLYSIIAIFGYFKWKQMMHYESK